MKFHAFPPCSAAIIASVMTFVLAVSCPLHGQAVVDRDTARAPGSEAPAAAASSRGQDTPAADYRIELLDLGYEAATAFPLVPHIKNRARAQERVLDAALEIGQRELAARYARSIPNFRRGTGLAKVAQAHAQALANAAGDAEADSEPEVDEIHRLLDQAAAVASAPGVDSWRKARVEIHRAIAFALIGERERARELIAGDTLSVGGDAKLAARARELITPQEVGYEQRLAKLKAMMQSDDFFTMHAALWGLAGLLEDHGHESQRRASILEVIESVPTKMPDALVTEVMFHVADGLLDRGEQRDSRRILKILEARRGEVETISLRYGVPLSAELAGLLHRSGQAEKARLVMEQTAERFASGRHEKAKLWYPDVLVSLAEARAIMGETGAALERYREAVVVTLENPNLRPRVDGMVSVVTSMAIHGVEPDEGLWQSFRAAVEELRSS